MNHDQSKIAWKYRRRYVIWVSLFIMSFMVYVVERLGDTRLTETAIQTGFMTLGALTGSYVFGAVWDHKNARDANVQSPKTSSYGDVMGQA